MPFAVPLSPLCSVCCRSWAPLFGRSLDRALQQKSMLEPQVVKVTSKGQRDAQIVRLKSSVAALHGKLDLIMKACCATRAPVLSRGLCLDGVGAWAGAFEAQRTRS